ncbi:MAG: regulatory protein RecX [Pyrinomonadaceae bacterium]
MQRAVKLLAAKPRSVEELRERLLEKEWTTAEIVDEVIGKLKQHGYLNDERFAFGYASYRVRQKPLGRQRLARDLQMKKVDAELARDALDVLYQETPEEELIERALKKRIALRGHPETRAETKSLFDYLMRLGFPSDLIVRKVRAAATTENLDLDEEASPG